MRTVQWKFSPMRLFAELNREELREAADSLVVLPLGATEQHGPHLATGTDFFTVQAVARAAAEEAGQSVPILVAPTLTFGSSDHHFVFGATLSLSTETYYRVVRELVESLVKDGFSRIFLINGHGGNHELAELVARDVCLHHPVKVGAGSYWAIAWEALVASQAHVGRNLPGHAGDFETSVMLALRPDLKPGQLPHRDNPPDTNPRFRTAPWRHERHGSWKEIGGYTDSPDQASVAKGENFLRIVIAEVARAFVDFYRS